MKPTVFFFFVLLMAAVAIPVQAKTLKREWEHSSGNVKISIKMEFSIPGEGECSAPFLLVINGRRENAPGVLIYSFCAITPAAAGKAGDSLIIVFSERGECEIWGSSNPSSEGKENISEEVLRKAIEKENYEVSYRLIGNERWRKGKATPMANKLVFAVARVLITTFVWEEYIVDPIVKTTKWENRDIFFPG